MSRTLPEPRETAQTARRLAVAGLRAFAADPLGKSLPASEALALRVQRLAAGRLAVQIDAGLYRGPLILEVRGYDLDSKGAPGENDFNTWDDAAFFLGIDAETVRAFVAVRGNVDPTRTDRGAFKAAPQLYFVHEGRHRDRRGLRQASPILVDRAGPGGMEYRVSPDRWPYTNHHEDKGAGTGSEGCSTMPNAEWGLMYGVAKGAGRIPVVIVDEKARRAGAYGPGL